jgi:hypothetical protein
VVALLERHFRLVIESSGILSRTGNRFALGDLQRCRGETFFALVLDFPTVRPSPGSLPIAPIHRVAKFDRARGFDSPSASVPARQPSPARLPRRSADALAGQLPVSAHSQRCEVRSCTWLRFTECESSSDRRRLACMFVKPEFAMWHPFRVRRKGGRGPVVIAALDHPLRSCHRGGCFSPAVSRGPLARCVCGGTWE